jgi:isoleucyl-tRNA synthetase
MYLEGSDQHRGWFHSSLLVGLGTRGLAPYRSVLTHGFVVTEDGKKMSKSLGNDIPPEQLVEQSGAEILRLWVAMTDYREEIRIGKEILSRVVEAYRKLRNTLRYLVANLYDFDPKAHALPVADLLEVDRYALARFAVAGLRMRAAYDAYEFAAAFQAANTLATVDLSAFYFDVSKDRMYTFGGNSRDRRSGQSAMYLIADGLVRLIAPLLPVTADELWRALPGEREDSVHLVEFPAGLDALADTALIERWERLIRVRETVLPAIEAQRQQKVLGQSLEAHVALTAAGETYDLLDRYRQDLPMMFIASKVSLEREGTEVSVAVSRVGGEKCPRCWRYVDHTAAGEPYTGLCERCADAVREPTGSTPA